MENNSKLSKEEEIKRIQQQKLHNEKLAVKFPEWDLLPPALLVQRKTKLCYQVHIQNGVKSLMK